MLRRSNIKARKHPGLMIGNFPAGIFLSFIFVKKFFFKKPFLSLKRLFRIIMDVYTALHHRY